MNGEHYHVLRSLDPSSLVRVGNDPHDPTTYSDSTPRSVIEYQVHYYKIVASNLCHEEAPEDR